MQGGSTADGAPLVQWGYNGSDTQKWTLTDTGNGQYKIIGLASGKAIDVSGASTSNGAGLLIWPYGGANNQKWTVTPTGDGYFKLTAVHSGKSADVNSGDFFELHRHQQLDQHHGPYFRPKHGGFSYRH